MKKIILATIGLAMFATPLAAENPQSGYPNAERYRSGPPVFSSSSHALGSHQQAFVAPSAMTQSYGLAAPGTRAGFEYSTSGPWQNQDLRDRYGRINR
jgi:hypothetical protein